jgi:hypothetical protein
MALADVSIRTRGPHGGVHTPDRVLVDGMDLSAFCFAVETRHDVAGAPSVVLHLHAGNIEIVHDPDPIHKGEECGA